MAVRDRLSQFLKDLKERYGSLSQSALSADSWIDSSLYSAFVNLREYYERFSAWMHGFHISGWRRWLLVEPLSEITTLGSGGLVLMLVLALPAFQETREDWLKRQDLSVTFLDRYGYVAGTRGIRHNDAVKLEELPDHLIKAVLATEDRRFYDHFGIDILGTFRALRENVQAQGVVQGGSSLSQQLAKNLFLSNERTIERKVKEAFLALWLESRLSKDEILKLYLDRAYMGGGAFGVDAAAQFYFGKSAREVTLAEAAMLAGLFKAPTKYAPHINLPAARERANVVLDNLVDAGLMTEGQVFGARRNPASAIDRRSETAPDYYLDWAFEEVSEIAEGFPKSVTERVFVVRTGLDLAVQRHAEKVVDTVLRQYGKDYHAKQSALVLMDTEGSVRAMVGGRDYGVSQFNRATDALRQPGSSFKPYVYATAFSNGYKPSTVVVDEPICLGNWCPQNYSHSFSGSVTLHMALQKSINTIPVKLSVMLGGGTPKKGRAKIIQLAHDMGLTTPLPDSSSLPIGAAEVTVLDQAQAYTTFATGGKAIKAHATLEIQSMGGEVLWQYDRNTNKPRQVLTPAVASDINRVLLSAVEDGTGKRAILDGIRASGKTGTTNGYRDAWFVGYTGNLVGAVWYGNDDYSPTNRMTGGSLPAMTWREVMEFAHTGLEIKPIFGLEGQSLPPPAQPAERLVMAENGTSASSPTTRPLTLSVKTSRLMLKIADQMDGISNRLPARSPSADASTPQRASSLSSPAP